jgi:hypothetical protein
VLPWVSALASLVALAAALADPSDDPLGAVLPILVAVPWIWVLDWINATLGAGAYWVNVAFACLGIIVNATLLYVAGRVVAAPSS